MNEIVKQTKRKDVGYKRPPIPGPGRSKGSKNKFTTLKEDWLWVHKAIGGRERLKKWVQKNDRNLTTFYQLETRLFPQEVAHSGEIAHTVVFKMPRPNSEKK